MKPTTHSRRQAHTLRVAAVQMEPAAGDKEANFAKLEKFVKNAAARVV